MVRTSAVWRPLGSKDGMAQLDARMHPKALNQKVLDAGAPEWLARDSIMLVAAQQQPALSPKARASIENRDRSVAAPRRLVHQPIGRYLARSSSATVLGVAGGCPPAAAIGPLILRHIVI
jgi:hypothetical protein